MTSSRQSLDQNTGKEEAETSKGVIHQPETEVSSGAAIGFSKPSPAVGFPFTPIHFGE